MQTEQIVQEAEARPTLSHHEQREVGLELRATLVELVDLALLGKQLHWSVVGPGFRPLHLQLDEPVDAWRELADTVLLLGSVSQQCAQHARCPVVSVRAPGAAKEQ